MKKFLLTAALIALMQCPAAAAEHKIGDVLGDIYSTDIITLLDNVPIPSYNLGGRTVIVLEDLEQYGFKVSYDDSRRRLDVMTDAKPSSYNTPEVTRGRVGTISGHYLYTDIKAYVNGIQVDSYNIGGRTCAVVEDLGELRDKYNEEAGWSDYNFVHSYNDSERTLYLYSYRFDGRKIDESVNTNALELYTTGGSGTYYGAKFEPKTGAYAGVVADGLDEFDTSFGVYSCYFEFDQKISWFMKNYRENVIDKDCVLLIPWNITDISSALYNDEYIRQTLDNINAMGKKAIIRFGAEMNCSGLGDSPTLYVKAFRHVADIVHEYDNMAVMWSPNDYGSANRNYDIYYPGDEYVDWIGISCFLKHDFGSKLNHYADSTLQLFGCGDYAWTTNSLKLMTDFMREHNINKPIAISEGAVESKVHYADIDLNGWAQPRLRAMYWYTAMKYPQVKMVTYFNQNVGGEIMDYKVTSEYSDIIEEAIKGAGYLTTSSDNSRISFTRAENKTYTDTMSIYTYAYFPHNTIKRVEYQIDGSIAAEAKEIPYKADINLKSLSHGTHTFTVKAVSDNETFTYNYNLTYNNGWKLTAK